MYACVYVGGLQCNSFGRFILIAIENQRSDCLTSISLRSGLVSLSPQRQTLTHIIPNTYFWNQCDCKQNFFSKMLNFPTVCSKLDLTLYLKKKVKARKWLRPSVVKRQKVSQCPNMWGVSNGWGGGTRCQASFNGPEETGEMAILRC